MVDGPPLTALNSGNYFSLLCSSFPESITGLKKNRPKYRKNRHRKYVLGSIFLKCQLFLLFRATLTELLIFSHI